LTKINKCGKGASGAVGSMFDTKSIGCLSVVSSSLTLFEQETLPLLQSTDQLVSGTDLSVIYINKKCFFHNQT